jgi:hypothetical protein
MNIVHQRNEQLFLDVKQPYAPSEPSLISSPHSEYHPSLDDLAVNEISNSRRDLQRLLRDQNYHGRIRTTNSYSSMEIKSQSRFRREVKHILNHVITILAPNDYIDVWNDLIYDESDDSKANEDGYSICLSLRDLAFT